MPREIAFTQGECAVVDPSVESVEGIASEGYELSVTPQGIVIRASGKAGVFYASQTLAQLAARDSDGKIVSYPCCEIRDAPRFRWRGVHFDDVRHFFGKETVKRTIDLMSRYKLNVFHWHLTDNEAWLLDVPDWPELVKQGKGAEFSEAAGPFYYTANDIREVVDYAAARHVTVVPEVEFPGHFRAAIRAYPELGCPGGGKVMCLGNPEAVKFAEAVLDRVCELFPSQTIHFGGDECKRKYWAKCPKCQAFIKEKGLTGEDELQQWFTRHIVDYLASKGRRAIGWDEIFIGSDALPKTTMGMCWRPQGAGAKAANDGYEIVRCPTTHCYFDFGQRVKDDPYVYFRDGDRAISLEKVYSFDPLDGVEEAAKANVLGAQCCNWTSETRCRYDMEWRLWPRALAMAEVLWTYPDPAKRDYREFAERAAVHRRRLIEDHVNCAPLPDAASAKIGRVVTCLDGNGWTLDGTAVAVPHCWNKTDGADGNPGGDASVRRGMTSVAATTYQRRRGVYARDLPDAHDARRYFIRCEGVSQKATVRVNGAEIGSHKGAFTAFCFEATEAMKPSGNRLEIEVDNSFDPDVPPISGDFTLAGGLYRSVSLIETPPVCIDPTIDGGPGVRVFPSMDGTVRVEADVSGQLDGWTVGLSISRRGAATQSNPQNLCASASSVPLCDQTVELSTKVENIKLWSPEEPNLYMVKVTVRKGEWSDSVEQPFGFRTAELREDDFCLNGVKRKVRGVNRHQDLDGKGWAMTADDEELDVRLIKEMGADAVRLSHYPQSPGIYSLCDRYGLMAWSEIPLVDKLGGAAFRENAKTMLREMIAQHRNNPSVCWWGLWNELYNCDKSSQGDEADWAAFSAELAGLCRALDPSRPVVAASCKPDRTLLNATVPGIAYNTYPLWYKKETMGALLGNFMEKNNLAVTALSEYGAGGSIFHHQNPPKRPKIVSEFHPEEYQTLVHITDLRQIKADERLWGSFLWAMFDFAADARREGDRHGINDKGLVTRDRTARKDAFYLYKANWKDEPLLHLCGKRMVSTTNETVQVTAFSNAGDVTLKVNGGTVGTKTPDEVCAVVFDDIALAPGENTILVEAGGMEEDCRWIREESRQ